MNLKLHLTYIFVLQHAKDKALFRIFKTKSTQTTFSANNSARNADFTRNQTNKTARAAAGCRPVGPAVAPPGVSDDPLNGDIRMRAQQLHITLLVGVAAGPDHQCGPVDNPRIAALRLDDPRVLLQAAHDRAQLVVLAYENGLVTPGRADA